MRRFFHKQSTPAGDRLVIANKEAAEFAMGNFFRARTEVPLIRITKKLVYKIKITLPGSKVSENDIWLIRAVMDSQKIRKISEKHSADVHKWQKLNMIHVTLCCFSGMLIARLLPPGIRESMAEITNFILSFGKPFPMNEMGKALDSIIMGGMTAALLATIYFIADYNIKTKRFARSLQAGIKEIVLGNSN
ncbi:MAG: hypothetical protein NTX79_00965 [Candidatus Micrarchaeota archaeon]|nr:hypothetical protein [Candidatus Micrarchaeota archaeon]